MAISESPSVIRLRALLAEDRDSSFVQSLSNLRGDWAVEYVLNILIEPGNTHTIRSTLDLIWRGRKALT